jgi:uncharacterized protein YchJ
MLWRLACRMATRAFTHLIPQVLMRSRYSAYVLGLTDYLLATWHPG